MASSLACALFSCGEPATVQAPTHPATTQAPPPGTDFGDIKWGAFHSTRFRISISLPDGKAWRIDDHSKPYFTAYHAVSNSHVTMYTSVERELVNHKACEDIARGVGLFPKEDLSTVESTITIGPEAYDSRIWVALSAVKKKGLPLTGHLFLIGAYIHTCLFMHMDTTVESADEEAELSGRLATARVTMIQGLKIDPPRTTEDSEVPREKLPVTK